MPRASDRLDRRSPRWFFVAVVAGLILITSVVPVPSEGVASPGPFGVVGVDKWAHAMAYAALAGAVAFALADRGQWSPRSVGIVSVSTLAYGLAIEMVQATISYRTFDPLDLVANVVGVFLAVLGWGLLAWRRRPAPRSSS